MTRAALDLMMSEERLLDTFRQAARLGGWRTYHTRDSRKSEQGFPDLILVRDRECIAAELKTERGRVTDAQRDSLACLDRVPGVEVHVVRPNMLDAFLERLARRTRKRP